MTAATTTTTTTRDEKAAILIGLHCDKSIECTHLASNPRTPCYAQNSSMNKKKNLANKKAKYVGSTEKKAKLAASLIRPLCQFTG